MPAKSSRSSVTRLLSSRSQYLKFYWFNVIMLFESSPNIIMSEGPQFQLRVPCMIVNNVIRSVTDQGPYFTFRTRQSKRWEDKLCTWQNIWAEVWHASFPYKNWILLLITVASCAQVFIGSRIFLHGVFLRVVCFFDKGERHSRMGIQSSQLLNINK
jgi:hypothetical protein